MLTKKMTTLILGSVAGTAGVVSGTTVGVSVNSTSITQDSTIDQDIQLLNDASVNEKTIFADKLTISSATNASLESAILSNIESIKAKMNGVQVEIEYMIGSASYFDASNSSAKFYVNPVEGHSWDDFTTTQKTVIVSFSNVSILTQAVANDAYAPETDVFTSKITLSSANDLELNKWLNAMNFNTISFVQKVQYGSLYKNVDLKFVEYSGSCETKTFRVQVTPSANHTWSNGTTSAKEIVVAINELYIVNSKAPTQSNIAIQVSLNKLTNDALDQELQKYDFSIPAILDNSSEYANVYIEYVVGSADVNAKTCKLTVTPLNGSMFTDGTTTSKTVLVNIPKLTLNCSMMLSETTLNTKVYVNSTSDTDLNTALSALNFTSNFQSLLSNGSEFKNVSVSYVNGSANFANNFFTLAVTPKTGYYWSDNSSSTRYAKVNISKQNLNVRVSVPSTTTIQLWGNKIIDPVGGKTFLQCLFTDEAISLLYSKINSTFFGVTSKYWLEGSQSLNNKYTEGKITVAVELANNSTNNYTLVWQDGSNAAVKNITVTVTGFKFLL